MNNTPYFRVFCKGIHVLDVVAPNEEEAIAEFHRKLPDQPGGPYVVFDGKSIEVKNAIAIRWPDWECPPDPPLASFDKDELVETPD